MSDFEDKFNLHLKKLTKNPPSPFKVFNSGMYKDDGEHQTHHTNYECVYAAEILSTIPSGAKLSILDVGSYRQFVIGLMSNPDWQVSVMDVRELPEPRLKNEIRIIGDIKDYNFNFKKFDVVISLCTIEHLGLGRYGDEFDIGADRKAMDNIKSALKSGGYFIFTTTLTGLPNPSIWYNAHRIYTYDYLLTFLDGMRMVDEMLLCPEPPEFRPMGEVTTNNYDIYCGCWRKK